MLQSRVDWRFQHDFSFQSDTDYGGNKAFDFRKGHDSLGSLMKNDLHKNPFTGTVIVFRSRKADRLKLIYWDSTGIVLAYNRLKAHTFSWPEIQVTLMSLNHAQFGTLFAKRDWRRIRAVETRTLITVE